MLAASRAESIETSGPRFGMVLIRPSLSSSRNASRTEGRLTPRRSQRSFSTRRWPGAKRPLVIAVRRVSTTWLRTGAATGATRIELSIVMGGSASAERVYTTALHLLRDGKGVHGIQNSVQ